MYIILRVKIWVLRYLQMDTCIRYIGDTLVLYLVKVEGLSRKFEEGSDTGVSIGDKTEDSGFDGENS